MKIRTNEYFCTIICKKHATNKNEKVIFDIIASMFGVEWSLRRTKSKTPALPQDYSIAHDCEMADETTVINSGLRKEASILTRRNPENEKVVAKIVTGIDDEYMYHEVPDNRCPSCHLLLKKREINLNYKVSKKRGSLRYTYDGYCIISEEFRTFCTKYAYPDLEFIEFPKSLGYYYFLAHRIYQLDPVRREIKFINLCKQCGNYEEIIGLTPGFTEPGFEPPDDFIYRSNYEFGTKDYKCPMIVVGLKTEKKMKEFGLKNLYFDDVYL
jgi:hypothetical protein